jgi:hypothetical protein
MHRIDPPRIGENDGWEKQFWGLTYGSNLLSAHQLCAGALHQNTIKTYHRPNEEQQIIWLPCGPISKQTAYGVITLLNYFRNANVLCNRMILLMQGTRACFGRFSAQIDFSIG